jgi:cis-L-3-hydroxyproline dehydratase
MRISRLAVYQVEYRLVDETYSWSNRLAIDRATSTIVKVTTDDGLEGFGEVCPLGSAYMAAFARGVPAAIQEIAPAVLGQDPLQLNLLNERMDLALGGHTYAKSPIDIACWDIFGKVAGQPISTLLGGRTRESYPPYRAIPQRSAGEMADDVRRFRERGYRKFQLKVGGEANEDIRRIRACREALEPEDLLVADSNTGWIPHEAIRVANAVRELDVYIEQPCRTLEECLAVREHTDLPMVLDEVILGVPALLQAHWSRAMDAVNLKISRLGGLTRAKTVRDLGESLGLAMTLEDSWGGDISAAAIAHFVGSTREEFYFSSTDFDSYVDLKLADDAPRMRGGLVPVPAGPGLGITVEEDRLGAPVAVFE